MADLNQNSNFIVSEDQDQFGYRIIDNIGEYESPIHDNKEDLVNLICIFIQKEEISYKNAFELLVNIIDLDLPTISSENEVSGYARIQYEHEFLDDLFAVLEDIEDAIRSSEIEKFPGICFFDEKEDSFVRIYFKVKDLQNGEEKMMRTENIYSLHQFKHQLNLLKNTYKLTEIEIDKLKYDVETNPLPETSTRDYHFNFSLNNYNVSLN